MYDVLSSVGKKLATLTAAQLRSEDNVASLGTTQDINSHSGNYRAVFFNVLYVSCGPHNVCCY